MLKICKAELGQRGLLLFSPHPALGDSLNKKEFPSKEAKKKKPLANFILERVEEEVAFLASYSGGARSRSSGAWPSLAPTPATSLWLPLYG